MTKELLIKYLNGRCTEEELREVIQWLNNDPFNNKYKYWGLEDWMHYKADDEIIEDHKFRALLDKIHHKINIIKQQTRKKPITLITSWLTKAAAILLIPVLAILIYTLSEKPSGIALYNELTIDSLEITAPMGSKTMVQFSDGSEVYLNNNSKLKYPQKFTGNKREVILVGEGYFNIAHDPERPFIVNTGKLNIKATGTIFNVFAYPEEKIVSTTLVDGKVVLERKGIYNNSESIGALEPGQHVIYDTEIKKIVYSSKGDIEKYIAWKDGKLIFKRDNLVQIAQRLSRWYNVDIEIASNELLDYTYTATFVDKTLDNILDLLKAAAPVDYKKLPPEISPDGTFSKQKIIINKRI